MNILFSWLGGSDRKAAETNPDPEDMGAIARTLRFDTVCYQKVVLLADGLKEKEQAYAAWLENYCQLHLATPLPKLELKLCNVRAMDRAALYQLMQQQIDDNSTADDRRSYLLSSGTPAMHLCWTLLGHTQPYRARLIDASKQEGVKEVPHWIELAHAFLPKARDVSSAVADWCAIADQTSKIAKKIIGTSAEQAKGWAALAAAMPSDWPVLISGETGTGKENIALLIHEAASQKSLKKGQFVAINCSAIPETLLEGELFGHKKGAFTGADADREGIFESAGEGGTVFLDEIGDMPLTLQSKLLRVLQEKKIMPLGSSKEIEIPNRRIVAATHKSLISGVSEGWFREDLYYRLNVLEIRLQPLRERMADLKDLTAYFLNTINQELANIEGLQQVGLDEDAYAVLFRHAWPGNIRELQNTLKRAVVHANAMNLGKIDAALLRQLILPSAKLQENWTTQPLDSLNLSSLIDKLSYHYYQRFMQEQPRIGREELAQHLSMTIPTLRKLEDKWQASGLAVFSRQERKKG